MGWTVLYIAFGIVALWLLGEVLLQYKARLRWRLLAFVGFLGVVVGVLIPSVIVIGLGAAAFAVGQTYVTLSFRRGFSSGWAVSAPALGPLGGGKRRGGEPDRKEPTLEVSDLKASEGGFGGDDGRYGHGDGDYGPDRGDYSHDSVDHGHDDYDRDDVFTPSRPDRSSAAETTAVYEPQPLPDETGTYGIYSDPARAAADQNYASADQPQDQYATADQSYAYDGYSGYDQQQYGYDATGQQQYAAYSDPYIGTQTYGGTSYDAYGQQQYGQQGYGQDQYATGTYGETTPPGGVWVPQQRTDEAYGGELPPEQQYPYEANGQQGNGQQGNGYDEQYRF
ncbi:hypothetical protein ABZ078_28710 [Streptomyces sp. NPDC006385]|uniref:SCO2102 family sporulation regulator n=1 Tax=Streptomyces sp. NPDC006385 TaxID=3156761 RepID=UPI0033AEA0FE